MRKIEKQIIPVVFNAEDEPMAIIFFSKNRDRVVYKVEKAGEDDLIELIDGGMTKDEIQKDNESWWYMNHSGANNIPPGYDNEGNAI